MNYYNYLLLINYYLYFLKNQFLKWNFCFHDFEKNFHLINLILVQYFLIFYLYSHLNFFSKKIKKIKNTELSPSMTNKISFWIHSSALDKLSFKEELILWLCKSILLIWLELFKLIFSSDHSFFVTFWEVFWDKLSKKNII